MAGTQEANPMRTERSAEELRAEMYAILDELVTARSDRAFALKKKFDELWDQIGTEQPSVH